MIQQSFAEYVEQMHDDKRSVAVFVEGDLAHEPPLGNAAAARIAHFLCEDEKDVCRMKPGEVTNEDQQDPESVGAIRVTLERGCDRDDWMPVQQRLMSRVPRHVDVVVLVDANEVPWFCNELCNVRVVADGIDEELEFYRVKFNPYEGETFYRPMSGFYGDNNGD